MFIHDVGKGDREKVTTHREIVRRLWDEHNCMAGCAWAHVVTIPGIAGKDVRLRPRTGSEKKFRKDCNAESNEYLNGCPAVRNTEQHIRTNELHIRSYS